MAEFHVTFANNNTETYGDDARWSVNDKNGVLTVREGGDDSFTAMYSPSAWLTVRTASNSGRATIV